MDGKSIYCGCRFLHREPPRNRPGRDLIYLKLLIINSLQYWHGLEEWPKPCISSTWFSKLVRRIGVLGSPGLDNIERNFYTGTRVGDCERSNSDCGAIGV